jgi:hypothetical protein
MNKADLHVYITKTIKEAAETLAKETGLSLSSFTEQALRAHIKRTK